MMSARSLTVAVLALVAVGWLADHPAAGTLRQGTHSARPAAYGRSAKAAPSRSAKIREAITAAPAPIGAHAAIVDWPDHPGGPMITLRAGSNGWTCYPSSPDAPGAVGQDPMCLDRQWQDWAAAWMDKRAPHVTGVGIGYMFKGDRGASNTDPFATASTTDNHWVRSGPHLMVLVPEAKWLDSLPTDPDNGGPWVMWKGTPYAHVMVPTR